MPRELKILFTLLAVFICCSFACSLRAQQDRVCFKDRCIQVEIADTDEKRVTGLQGRADLTPNAGMLFVFGRSGRYSFWMKDTLIPLDIIWLDRERKIVDLQSAVPPCRQDPCQTYMPLHPAEYVLEVKGGTAKRLGLIIGSQADFYLDKYSTE